MIMQLLLSLGQSLMKLFVLVPILIPLLGRPVVHPLHIPYLLFILIAHLPELKHLIILSVLCLSRLILNTGEIVIQLDLHGRVRCLDVERVLIASNVAQHGNGVEGLHLKFMI